MEYNIGEGIKVADTISLLAAVGFFKLIPFFISYLFTAEIVHNASGLGYLGQDKDGNHDWSGMCNVKVWKIEVSVNSFLK